MDFLTLLLQPTGFWENIIFGLDNVINNYAITLIVITLIIKFVMLPFDFLNKYITKYNSRKQGKLKPQLDKLQKAYSNNQQMLNQKTMELYKRENYSVIGTCVGMLLNMAITMVVFFTLFAALNNIATYKQVNEFVVLQQTYYSEVLVQNGVDTTALSTEEIIADYIALTPEQQTTYQTQAQDAVLTKYEEIRSNFLWIKNIWKQDTSTNAILTYTEWQKVANDDTVTQADYELIMNPVDQNYGGANGWYILIVLSAATTFLSMQLTTWINKAKAKRKGDVYTDPVGSNKILIYLMPAILAIFTLLYNAAFGLYIVTGGMFAMITSPLTGLVADAVDKNVEKRENSKNTISYSR